MKIKHKKYTKSSYPFKLEWLASLSSGEDKMSYHVVDGMDLATTIVAILSSHDFIKWVTDETIMSKLLDDYRKERDSGES